jgi:hypothetical protein
MSRVLATMAALAVVVSSFAFNANVALGHEKRAVGPFDIEVGWLVEPALVGQLNGLDLTVVETQGGKPVEGLEKAVNAEVIVGGGAKTLPLTLQASEDRPGHYAGQFIPTKAGDYIFHITGTAESTKIDERFESGPNTFDGAVPSEPLQFPQTIPSGVDLAARLDTLQTLAMAGIGVGVLALLVSIGGLVIRRT